MEKYLIDLAVILIGAGVIAVVKSSINGLKLELQQMFVTRPMCELQHRSEAKEREDIRKDVQNHEERLNAVGA